MKIVGLTPEDFAAVVKYLSGTRPDFKYSDVAAAALAAVKRAKDYEVEIPHGRPPVVPLGGGQKQDENKIEDNINQEKQ